MAVSNPGLYLAYHTKDWLGNYSSVIDFLQPILKQDKVEI